ncbi:MAG: hypothetical protein HUU14_12390 [Dehalococcoidia bacterium]|nr:hypothetical protein [Dehalococcoidia bacterium]NUQ56679.1 hypothetical protein [Dehalococcoidia bacterium]RIL02082.1 MAG: hypothetical protein DCC78_08390 [bacterium]
MTAATPGRTIAERVLDSFPAGSYALHGFLQLLDIVESEDVPTAATQCRLQPKMLVNPRFVEEHAKTPEKLLMLVMHELHHVLLGHTRLFPRVSAVDNLVFDAVINSLLCRMLPAPEHIRFFTDYYDDASFPSCLLRPPASWLEGPAPTFNCPPGLQARGMEAARGVYEQLYSARGASYQDLYEVLRRQVTDEGAATVPLLGGHCGAKESIEDVDLRDGPPVLFDAVRRIVEEWPQPPDPIAGRSLEDVIGESRVAPRSEAANRQILRRLLRQVGGIEGGRSFSRAWRDEARTIESPIPSFQRRSLVLGALGTRPLLHPATFMDRRRTPAGDRVHVYLDVSGSIGDLKGSLYGAVHDCQAFVHPQVHLFSTVVVDVSFAALRDGVCHTTGGTSIACVAEHMEANRVKRAAIITDGFVGRLSGDHARVLGAARVGVALTPGAAWRRDLEPATNYWAQLRPPARKE